MKQNKTYYVVVDRILKLFVSAIYHHSYSTDNKTVFDVRFTDKISEAMLCSKKDAQDLWEKTFSNDFITMIGPKTNRYALEVDSVKVTYDYIRFKK